MKKFFLLFMLAFISGQIAEAKVKIERIDFEESNTRAKIIINTKGFLEVSPDLSFKDKMIQLEIPESFVWPKIEKKVSISSKYDTTSYGISI